jgi:uncharacterized membrane protein YebE (DUF533 family)
MTNSILKMAFGGLIAAGLMAYGQQPQDNSQPAQQQEKQTQPQTPAGAPQQPQSAEQVFAALDTNKDGKLSPDEFGKLFRDAKVSDVQAEFAKWDKNGDKSITMEEFKAGFPQQ